ncbi:prepilin-type N-terminal cleavage/methylation domain-containing protein [Stutzerimonas xanthomarina]|uniref:type II secretion system protein n=1 Tax=Stutzerimonas nitrititolerans TaxID=2482751 RepID=UPI000825AB30|nr:prepilin-type N-terminal cleavage/methylation domain-containing protein [Stutzerimonas nitrititolerans]OCX21680.1 prepilin-type N-terminal cleavage/methylation domain-containing protein [Stutzerimonas xanthomarina]HBB78329.1 prepilin-type N-terminal cleavage/methylation domain-containing protein [Pseudomonas sp.]
MTTNSCSRQRGFTLLEMSVVLIIVALIVSALTLGSDLQRNTVYQHLASSFVRGWQLSYLSHADRVGVAPGDSQTTPTGKVNAADDSELCDLDLRNAMYAAGVTMPQGRAEGFETHYGYLDSNGNPQDVSACFANVAWSVPGSSAGVYVVQRKNVLILRGLTPDLARMLDGLVDGNADARFGSFREQAQASDTSASSVEWSLGSGVAYGETDATNLDESQVVTLTAYYLMDR